MRFEAAARRAARVAAVTLGWRPDDFWAATPTDLCTALGLDDAGDDLPVTADVLARLMEGCPDDR